MTTETWNAARVADTLLSCERGRTPRTSIAAEVARPDLHTAYIAQDIALADRRSNGEVVTGVKLGLTSRAGQQQMGVDEPSVAWLTDAMVRYPPVCRCRPTGSSIHVPNQKSHSSWAGAWQVPGRHRCYGTRSRRRYPRRHRDHRQPVPVSKFTLADAVADNNSSGVYVTGDRSSRGDVDPPPEACLLEIDGHVVDSATGSAVLEPGRSLAFAANTLAARGHAIEAGWIVLTGGMTDAVAVERGARSPHFHHARIHHTRGRIAIPIIDVTLTQDDRRSSCAPSSTSSPSRPSGPTYLDVDPGDGAKYRQPISPPAM